VRSGLQRIFKQDLQTCRLPLRLKWHHFWQFSRLHTISFIDYLLPHMNIRWRDVWRSYLVFMLWLRAMGRYAVKISPHKYVQYKQVCVCVCVCVQWEAYWSLLKQGSPFLQALGLGWRDWRCSSEEWEDKREKWEGWKGCIPPDMEGKSAQIFPC